MSNSITRWQFSNGIEQKQIGGAVDSKCATYIRDRLSRHLVDVVNISCVVPAICYIGGSRKMFNLAEEVGCAICSTINLVTRAVIVRIRFNC